MKSQNSNPNVPGYRAATPAHIVRAVAAAKLAESMDTTPQSTPEPLRVTLADLTPQANPYAGKTFGALAIAYGEETLKATHARLQGQRADATRHLQNIELIERARERFYKLNTARDMERMRRQAS